MMEDERSPNQLRNLEAEQALLGALLRNNQVIDLVGGIVEPEHFAEAVHARIFEAARALVGKGTPASEITLKTWFEGDGTLREIGGIEYLITLASRAVTIINAPQYAEIVRDLAIRRDLIEKAEALISSVYLMPVDGVVQDLAAMAADELLGVAARGTSRHVRSIHDVANSALDDIQKRMNGERDQSLIKTGITALDNRTGGIARGELVLLGGRPGMGKSALGDVIALNAAMAGHPTLLWTGEMPAETIAERLMSSLEYPAGAIPYSLASRGNIGAKQFERLCNTLPTLLPVALRIDDRAAISVSQLRASAVQARIRMKGLDLIVIDYIGLMKAGNRYGGRKVDEIGEISTALKQLARELKVGILGLHQLSRAVESRDGKRPQLSDLRDSGNLEQDADQVWFAFREEYYLEREAHQATGMKQVEADDALRAARHRMEIIIDKVRRGPTGVAKVFCDIGSNYIGGLGDDSDQAAFL